MPSPDAVSADAFVSRLRDSGLLSSQDLLAAMLGGDPSAVADDLVRAGKLTRFQADAVLEGRVGELRIGTNYDVIDQLGKGGMGTVFKARHRRMKRVVALKVFSKEVASESFVQRFQREVETIAQLSHPNIVMAFDADVADIGHFLVMEFVDGRDLAGEVFQNGPLSVADAVDCTIQAGRGLEFAHARTIVHRDIKPANLLRDASGTVKVADLGLARLTAAGGDPSTASLTQAGGIVGTTEYMAPEQAVDSTTIDHRADIYSLGCTLYFLLTGKAPYSGNSIMGLLLKHRDAAIPAMRDHRTDVPHALDALFARMVAKRPEDRHPTMTAVLADLEKLRSTTVLPTARPTQKSAAPSHTDATILADSAEVLAASQDTKQTSPSSVGRASPTSSALGRVSDLCVVLVESSRTQADIIRKYFDQLGVKQLHTAGTGKLALEAVKANRAQAVVSALHLSDTTGVQLLQALRADADCASIGFVLMTSEDIPEAGVLTTLPPALLLHKPFDLARLADALARVTGRLPG